MEANILSLLSQNTAKDTKHKHNALYNTKQYPLSKAKVKLSSNKHDRPKFKSD